MPQGQKQNPGVVKAMSDCLDAILKGTETSFDGVTIALIKAYVKKHHRQVDPSEVQKAIKTAKELGRFNYYVLKDGVPHEDYDNIVSLQRAAKKLNSVKTNKEELGTILEQHCLEGFKAFMDGRTNRNAHFGTDPVPPKPHCFSPLLTNEAYMLQVKDSISLVHGLSAVKIMMIKSFNQIYKKCAKTYRRGMRSDSVSAQTRSAKKKERARTPSPGSGSAAKERRAAHFSPFTLDRRRLLNLFEVQAVHSILKTPTEAKDTDQRGAIPTNLQSTNVNENEGEDAAPPTLVEEGEKAKENGNEEQDGDDGTNEDKSKDADEETKTAAAAAAAAATATTVTQKDTEEKTATAAGEMDADVSAKAAAATTLAKKQQQKQQAAKTKAATAKAQQIKKDRADDDHEDHGENLVDLLRNGKDDNNTDGATSDESITTTTTVDKRSTKVSHIPKSSPSSSLSSNKAKIVAADDELAIDDTSTGKDERTQSNQKSDGTVGNEDSINGNNNVPTPVQFKLHAQVERDLNNELVGLKQELSDTKAELNSEKTTRAQVERDLRTQLGQANETQGRLQAELENSKTHINELKRNLQVYQDAARGAEATATENLNAKRDSSQLNEELNEGGGGGEEEDINDEAVAVAVVPALVPLPPPLNERGRGDEEEDINDEAVAVVPALVLLPPPLNEGGGGGEEEDINDETVAVVLPPPLNEGGGEEDEDNRDAIQMMDNRNGLFIILWALRLVTVVATVSLIRNQSTAGLAAAASDSETSLFSSWIPNNWSYGWGNTDA